MSLKVHTLTSLLSLEQPKLLYYLESQLLSYGGTMFIYGRAGTYKSFLSIELMYALATGKRWLAWNTIGSPLKTLMVQAEQVEAMYQDRLQDYTKKRIPKLDITKVDEYMLFATAQDLRLDHMGMAQLRVAIKEHQPQVVILDCLYRMVSSTSDPAVMKPFFDDLTLISAEYGTAFIIIHHRRKESDEDHGFDELTGWAGIANWADSILRVNRDGQSNNLELIWEKTKNARKEVPSVNIYVDQENLRFLQTRPS